MFPPNRGNRFFKAECEIEREVDFLGSMKRAAALNGRAQRLVMGIVKIRTQVLENVLVRRDSGRKDQRLDSLRQSVPQELAKGPLPDVKL
ncbi:MAG: hypothetical protein WCL32_18145, partial [Planctomycetota bacterium]